jgi:hypothetical protein
MLKIKIEYVMLLEMLIFILSPVAASNPTSIPISHPVYTYLERMEALGYAENLLDGIRPYSRAKVADILVELDNKRDQLTPIDREKLDEFLLDFRYEIRPDEKYYRTPENQNWYSILGSISNIKSDVWRFFQRNQPEEENHIIIWEKEGNSFYMDYEQGLDYEKRSDAVYRSASWQNYQFRGTINSNFGYQLEFSLQGLRGNDDDYIAEHPILKGSWSQQKEDEPRYGDRTGGELAWHTGYIDFHFAQQEVEWGHGESGKLILSNNPEPYPYLSLEKEWGWGKFISLHGKLQSFPQDTLEDGYQVYPDKWLAAHRLEFTIWKKVTFGFNENYIYGNRYADWSYMIPFNFYRAVQHKLRDRDNATISIDLEYLLYAGIKVYGTVFLDEFKQNELGTDWYGNKHAFLGGFYWVDPIGLNNTSLRFEYTAIMPWVYTHKYDINSYTTDYNSLGHWSGPNSEVYYVHLAKEWTRRLNTGIKFRQWKKGYNYDNENIGGDILVGHGYLLGNQTQPRETRKFLEGKLATEKRYQIYFNYELWNDFYISGGFNYIDLTVENKQDYLNEIFFGVKLQY